MYPYSYLWKRYHKLVKKGYISSYYKVTLAMLNCKRFSNINKLRELRRLHKNTIKRRNLEFHAKNSYYMELYVRDIETVQAWFNMPPFGNVVAGTWNIEKVRNFLGQEFTVTYVDHGLHEDRGYVVTIGDLTMYYSINFEFYDNFRSLTTTEFSYEVNIMNNTGPLRFDYRICMKHMMTLLNEIKKRIIGRFEVPQKHVLGYLSCNVSNGLPQGENVKISIYNNKDDCFNHLYVNVEGETHEIEMEDLVENIKKINEIMDSHSDFFNPL